MSSAPPTACTHPPVTAWVLGCGACLSYRHCVAAFPSNETLWTLVNAKTLRVGADDINEVFDHTGAAHVVYFWLFQADAAAKSDTALVCAEGGQVCRQLLFEYYLQQAAQQYSLRSENRVDAALCRAGLWCVHAAAHRAAASRMPS